MSYRYFIHAIRFGEKGLLKVKFDTDTGLKTFIYADGTSFNQESSDLEFERGLFDDLVRDGRWLEVLE